MYRKLMSVAVATVFIAALPLSGLAVEGPSGDSDKSLLANHAGYVADSLRDARIDSIQKDVCSLREKQEQVTFMNEGFNLLGVVSIFIAAFTLLGIDRVKKNHVDKKTQYRLFVDMIRHLYRNKVCTLAMYGKWKDLINQGKDCYPSEEHLLKLQVLPEDLHFERYYQDPDKYHLMHEMELLLRNYNTEIEVVQAHLSNPAMDMKTKERDFATLNFKPGYLTVEILKLMQELSGKSLKHYYKVAISIIQEEHKKKEEKNKGNEWNLKILEVLEPLIVAERENDSYFKDIFEDSPKDFEEILRIDLQIEAGKNKKGSEKIHIIQRS